MNLNSRLSKLESGRGLAQVSMVIVAENQAEFDRQFEDRLLALPGPCRLSVSGTNSGNPLLGDEMEIMTHEEHLEMLS
jgi:hypothetical protein